MKGCGISSMFLICLQVGVATADRTAAMHLSVGEAARVLGQKVILEYDGRDSSSTRAALNFVVEMTTVLEEMGFATSLPSQPTNPNLNLDPDETLHFPVIAVRLPPPSAPVVKVFAFPTNTRSRNGTPPLQSTFRSGDNDYLEQASVSILSAAEMAVDKNGNGGFVQDSQRAAQREMVYSTSSPSADHRWAAAHFRSLRQHQRALSAMRAAVKFNPADPGNWYEFGKSLKEMAHLPEAVDAFERSSLIANKRIDKQMQRELRDQLDSTEKDIAKFDRYVTRMGRTFDLHVLSDTVEAASTLQASPASKTANHELELPPCLSSMFEEGVGSCPPKIAVIRMPSPKSAARDGDNAWLEFLRSRKFRQNYFERYPVLLTPYDDSDDGGGGGDSDSSDSGGSGGGSGKRNQPSAPGMHEAFGLGHIDLDYILDRPAGYRYSHDAGIYGDDYANINYLLDGTFSKDHSVAKESVQKRDEIVAQLRKGSVLQMLQIHRWEPLIAQFIYDLSVLAVQLPTNVNMYVTPPGVATSLRPHTDFQCSLMVQLQGKKRWRLWVKPSTMLPTRFHHIRGRDADDPLFEEKLGEPYLDVVVHPGEAVYVPRGCIHLTSTPPAERSDGRTLIEEASVHLTVGMEALLDGDMGTTWETFFFGSGHFRHQRHSLFFAALLHQMRTRGDGGVIRGAERWSKRKVGGVQGEGAEEGGGKERDEDGEKGSTRANQLASLGHFLRSTVPATLFNPDMGYAGESWMDTGRRIAHQLVDGVFDAGRGEPEGESLDFVFIDEIQKRLRTQVRRHNLDLVNLFGAEPRAGDGTPRPGDPEFDELHRQAGGPGRKHISGEVTPAFEKGAGRDIGGQNGGKERKKRRRPTKNRNDDGDTRKTTTTTNKNEKNTKEQKMKKRKGKGRGGKSMPS